MSQVHAIKIKKIGTPIIFTLIALKLEQSDQEIHAISHTEGKKISRNFNVSHGLKQWDITKRSQMAM